MADTMGHYSEHLSANSAAGVNHLTPPRSSLANNYGVKSPIPSSPLATPNLGVGELNPVNASQAPKGTVFGAPGK